jgi:hypothetical protein
MGSRTQSLGLPPHNAVVDKSLLTKLTDRTIILATERTYLLARRPFNDTK